MRLTLLVALLCSGCVLDPTFCGEGFVERANRCVPADDPPAYYADAAPVAVIRDARPPATDDGLQPPDAAPDIGRPNPWADRTVMLLVDRGGRNEARRTPATPGYDLDAVRFVSADGDELGWLGEILDARINDPFGRNAAFDPRSALGRSDADSIESIRRYVSLGTEGGFLFATTQLERPLQPGDRILPLEMPGDRDDEPVEIYLCLAGEPDIDRCVSIGTVRGREPLSLP